MKRLVSDSTADRQRLVSDNFSFRRVFNRSGATQAWYITDL